MALSNTSFDSRLATTIPLWVSNNLADLITGNNPFFFRLREKGNVIRGGGHGGQFVEPIMFPDASGPAVVNVANASTAYTALTFAETTNMSAASYAVAEKLLPISIQNYDLLAQGSETQKVGLIESVMKASIAKFNENLNADLWASEETTTSAGSRGTLASIRTFFNGAGSSTTDGGANPPALTEQGASRAVCSASTQTAVQTVGGINRNATGAAYWNTPIINTSQALSIQTLSSLVSLATRGADTPDLIMLHRDMYDKLMGILVSNSGGGGGQMFTQSRLVEAGFEAIRFRNCDVIFDDRVPKTSYLTGSSTQYGYNAFCLNTDYLKLRAVSMKPDVKEYPDPRAIRVWTGYWSGQITSGNLGRVHSRHVNLS